MWTKKKWLNRIHFSCPPPASHSTLQQPRLSIIPSGFENLLGPVSDNDTNADGSQYDVSTDSIHNSNIRNSNIRNCNIVATSTFNEENSIGNDTLPPILPVWITNYPHPPPHLEVQGRRKNREPGFDQTVSTIDTLQPSVRLSRDHVFASWKRVSLCTQEPRCLSLTFLLCTHLYLLTVRAYS